MSLPYGKRGRHIDEKGLIYEIHCLYDRLARGGYGPFDYECCRNLSLLIWCIDIQRSCWCSSLQLAYKPKPWQPVFSFKRWNPSVNSLRQPLGAIEPEGQPGADFSLCSSKCYGGLSKTSLGKQRKEKAHKACRNLRSPAPSSTFRETGQGTLASWASGLVLELAGQYSE